MCTNTIQVCGFGQGIEFAHAKNTNGIFGSNLAGWNGSLFSLSLATNVTVTSLITFRIWYAFLILPLCDTSVTPFRYLARQIASHISTPSVYRRALVLVVESGAIYSSALVFEIISYFLNSNVFYIMYNPIAQLTVSCRSVVPDVFDDIVYWKAIVPTMIIVMTSLGFTSNANPQESGSIIPLNSNCNTRSQPLSSFGMASRQSADTMKVVDIVATTPLPSHAV